MTILQSQLGAAGPGGASAMELISSSDADNVASVAFTGLSSTYFAYILVMSRVRALSGHPHLCMRTSSNNGSSYDSGASDYAWTGYGRNDGGNAFAGLLADSYLRITGDGASRDLGTDAAEEVYGHLVIFNPSASEYTKVVGQISYQDNDLDPVAFSAGGVRLSAADVDAIQILMDSGNLSGTFKLYGLKA